MATDLATQQAGACIVMATCCDESHPPSNVLDEAEASFWATTGCFPQEIVVDLATAVDVSRITAKLVNAKKVLLEGCAQSNPGRFEKIKELSFKCTPSQLQVDRCETEQRLRFVKLTILEGWESFAFVNRISVIGVPAEGSDDAA